MLIPKEDCKAASKLLQQASVWITFGCDPVEPVEESEMIARQEKAKSFLEEARALILKGDQC